MATSPLQRYLAFATLFVLLLTLIFCLSRQEARLMLRNSFDRVTTKRTKRPLNKAMYATYNSSLNALEHMTPMSLSTIHFGIHDTAMKKANLLYIYIPKAGSTTMRETLSANASSTNPMIDETATRVHMKDMDSSKYFTFSMLRNPRERIVSAYATVISRGGVIGVCDNGKHQFKSPPIPNVTNSSAWKDHFLQTLFDWVTILKDNPFDQSCQWNEHLIPQVEFLRGYHLSWLGCMERMNETFSLISQMSSVPLAPLKRGNTYEHNDGTMPKHRFQSSGMLPQELVNMVDAIYAEDWALYQAACEQV